MKKLFTLALALMGFIGAANAATVADIAPLKHSYVLVCEDLGARPGKGNLFGDNHFLDVTGGSTATNKGSVDLSVADGVLVTEEIAAKYGEYGKHLNFLRLKKTQDVIAMSVTAKSKVIIFYQDNNKDDRYPVFAKDAGLSDRFADGVRSERSSGEEGMPAVNLRRIEWTATDDGVVYVGDNNGDMFMSYIIIEANEAPGTPTVKVGEQKFEDGLWFREVSVKANDYKMEGSDEGIPTIVTYTTDGSTPTATSPVYSEPIKCFKDMTVKFQAYQDWGVGADEGFICDGADNEANVNFLFDAPTIEADGAKIKVVSPYEGQGAINFFKLNDGFEIEDNEATLTESATVTAFTKIDNGVYGTFTSKSTTKDVYVLNPIKEKKTITVAGSAVVDEEATAASTDGSTIYKIEDGIITVDKADFFVKNLTFAALANADAAKAQYQVPAGQEAYIQMSNTNITFMVAEGDSVTVKVICSKNACKNIDADDAAEDKLVNGCTPDRSCYVNVSGTNYCHLDQLGGVAADQKLFPDANIIEFGLKGAEGGSIFTFQKYSGTGNILISSIEITPANKTLPLADFADGNYYLMNVSSVKAWGAGNSWGTQGSLVKHPEYVTLHKQEDGTYFMETQVSNGGESYYFGGEYMDGSPVALTITQGEELGKDVNGNPVYVYYITADGTNYYGWDGTENTVLARNLAAGDRNAMWIIGSHELAVAGLAQATAEDPMDATFLLLDPNFGRNNRNVNAWTGDTFSVGGDNTNMNAEKWGGNSQNFDISQTVDAPNGKYVISWNGFYRYNNTADNTNDVAVAAHADGTEVINSFVYINGKDYPLCSIADDAASAALEGKLPFSQADASAAFGQGLYAQSAEVYVTDGKLTVGIKKTEHPGTDWTVWDNFEIMYYGPAEEPVEGNEVDITSKFTYTWNASESFVNNADGSITFNAVQWGGLAAWLKDGDNPADWSDYSKLVFEYAEPTTVSTQILVSGTEAKAWGDAGITSLECSFEGLDMTTVEQVALQTADATTITIKRVYLVKKGGDEPVPADPDNLVKNWDCSGDDASSFWVHEWRTMDTQTDGPANLVNGAAMVYVRSFEQAAAAGNATLKDGNKENVTLDNFADWDSQFFITWDEAKATAAGDKLQLKMKVKADKAQTIASQLHKAPGAYVHWYAVGDINVTTEWTDFVSAEVDVVAGNDPGYGKTAEGCWTIAFNLAKGEENTIYFDDMVVYVIKPTGITEMYRINPEDGVRYNLAGKRVDDSYKGIVIMNGKKMLQK